MKTTEEIIEHLEKEQAYCYAMHATYCGKDTMNALEYLIRATTITGLLAEIKDQSRKDENQMITLQKQAADGLIIKMIQHGVVKTQSFVDGKPGHIDNKDIKRLGYKSTHDYVMSLIEQGYMIKD